MNHEQLALFGTAQQIPPQPSTRPTASRTPRPRRHTADAAIEVLSEVRDGRYGMLDDTDFVMVFTEPDRVRKAVDDDLVHHFIAAGLIRCGSKRDTLACLHGAIRRPVTPLALTAKGRTQLARWCALHPLKRK